VAERARRHEAVGPRVERDLDVPVLHLPQMVGLALGLEPKDLGMNKHVVKTKSVQRKLAELAAA
jgi:succinate dehydrogenase / fumarate reductase cytochrome b subunit